jgi:hypothetical protein
MTNIIRFKTEQEAIEFVLKSEINFLILKVGDFYELVLG